MMDKHSYKLFITGQTPTSMRAITNIRAILGVLLPADAELEVIDVLERPDLAEQMRILATPTLLRESPAPMRRVLGDLSDRSKVMAGLHLEPVNTPKEL